MLRLMFCVIISCSIPTWCLPPRVTDQYTTPTSDLEAHQFDTQHSLDKYDVLQPESDITLEQEYGTPTSKLKLITKNIYVHIPPFDDQEIQPVRSNTVIPKKHYNIIFIKAPTTAAPKIPEPLQDEHKTLVYILVKNTPHELVLPKQIPTEPSKPEIFFVKYKDNEQDKEI